MMRKARLSWCKALVLMVLLALVGCKPSVPSEFIQQSEMEDVLYDYHLSMAMVSREGYSDTKIKAAKLAVLNKYQITEAQFDSSLQYYMRHADRLHDIYLEISKRLENEARLQGASESELNQFGNITAKGDTADIWKGPRALVFSPYAPMNRETFEIKADSSFHKGDRLLMNFDSQYIIQDGTRDAVIVMAITYDNDSIATQSLHISSDSHQSLVIDGGDSLRIKNIRGYFMMLRGQVSTSTFKLLILSNIRLVKMHVKKAEQSTEGDSLQRTDPIRTIGGEAIERPTQPADGGTPPTPAPTSPPTEPPTMTRRP